MRPSLDSVMLLSLPAANTKYIFVTTFSLFVYFFSKLSNKQIAIITTTASFHLSCVLYCILIYYINEYTQVIITKRLNTHFWSAPGSVFEF